MALTGSSVKRFDDATGDVFATWDDGAKEHQSFVMSDADGQPIAYGFQGISAVAEDSKVIKASAGAAGELHAYLDGLSGTAVCAMCFNATSLPANGTTPYWRIPLIGGVGSYWFPTGLLFTTGLVMAFSSTHANLTVTTGSEGFFQTRHR